MADFIKVVNHRIRMCNANYDKTGEGCEGCPLFEFHNGYCTSCDEWILDNPEKTQIAIMQWAKENPETRMPTWREWLEDPRSMTEDALNMPIPEHLLPILNIEPIVVEEE